MSCIKCLIDWRMYEIVQHSQLGKITTYYHWYPPQISSWCKYTKQLHIDPCKGINAYISETSQTVLLNLQLSSRRFLFSVIDLYLSEYIFSLITSSYIRCCFLNSLLFVQKRCIKNLYIQENLRTQTRFLGWDKVQSCRHVRNYKGYAPWS